MHIGIDARLTYYRRGGISTYISRLIPALEALDTTNTYTVFQSRKSRDTLTTRFRHASLWTPCHHRYERYALSAELLRFNLDVLHTTDFIPPLRGAKHHIATVHDVTFLHYPQYLTEESRRYYNDQIAYAVEHADHILTISEASKRDIISLLNVPEKKITVHLLGVDESFQPLPPQTVAHYLRAMELPDAYFLFVGTFEPRKNMLGLAQAYRALLDQHPDAPSLVFVGTRGWNFEEIETGIEALNLGDKLIWREAAPQDAMPALYNGALALVLPSFYEGFGFPALEAMASGTPPIVSNRSSLPEVVGDVGILIDPENHSALTDALLRAWQDDDWRITQGQAGLERAKRFNWESTARTALSIYQSFA